MGCHEKSLKNVYTTKVTLGTQKGISHRQLCIVVGMFVQTGFTSDPDLTSWAAVRSPQVLGTTGVNGGPYCMPRVRIKKL